jgi:hypothetical protein
MTKDYPGEQWKVIEFDFEYTNDFRIEVSNFGRIRTFNKISNGNILNGSMVNGYRIIRLKLYRPREEQIQTKLNDLQQQVLKLARKLRSQVINGEKKEVIDETSARLDKFKKSVSKKFQKDLKERTINYHFLVHRFVAVYFLNKPTPKQTLVAHLDFDKLNNRASNLKWMAPEENYEHQKRSPYVISDKQKRQQRQQSNPNRTKLTVTRVMLLKKLLNEGKPMKQLVKLFKVTDTQIIRIKRGENWANIQPLT